MFTKECIIHIEGADKTGKDTVRNEIVKQSQGKVLVIVRSYVSQIVYSRIYKREINENFFFNKMLIDYNNGHNFIFLSAEQKDAEKRFLEHQETDLKIEDFTMHQKIFKSVISDSARFGIYFKCINTSENNLEQTVKLISELI